MERERVVQKVWLARAVLVAVFVAYGLNTTGEWPSHLSGWLGWVLFAVTVFYGFERITTGAIVVNGWARVSAAIHGADLDQKAQMLTQLPHLLAHAPNSFRALAWEAVTRDIKDARFADARAILEAFPKSEAPSAVVLAALALANAHLGQFELALSQSEDALAIARRSKQPPLSFFVGVRGLALHKAGRSSEALPFLDEAVGSTSSTPGETQTFVYWLAEAHAGAANPGRAAEEYERAIKLAPETPCAREAQAALLKLLRPTAP